jgi:hypothetical protein
VKINVTHNIPEVQAAIERAASQVPFAMAMALNKTVEKAAGNVRQSMQSVFDRPTPWVLNSLRIKRATKALPEAELAFKDKNSVESSRSMVEPHVFAGKRHHKAMEARLLAMGLMPKGYNAVPGAAAQLDGFGNMSRGQITQLLNVLGTYTEAGYNKANSNTVKRLAKGNVKKNMYGFVYWVNKVGSAKGRHLQPGVYQRVSTGFGSSLRPVLVFVRQAAYKARLDMFGITQRTVDAEFVGEFNQAFDMAWRTAIVKTQSGLF